MKLKIYKSDAYQKEYNKVYPHEIEVVDEETFKEAVSKDYVCAKYKDNSRSNDNFIESNCLVVDCDNEKTNDKSKWLTKEKLEELFPDVAYAIHYSRNNMKDKDKGNGVIVSARPRFHVFFEIEPVYSQKEYAKLKQYFNMMYPYFDDKALDSARFFYGTKEANVEFHQGSLNLTEFLDDDDFDKDLDVIKVGSRNATLSRYAAKVLKRLGNTTEAINAFKLRAKKCEEPLPDSELDVIWKSAIRFLSKIQKDPNYIPPDKYQGTTSYWPSDYSDMGQARALISIKGDTLIYTDATEYLHFNGEYWEESRQMAVSIMEDFLDEQLEDAKVQVSSSFEELKALGVNEVDIASGGKKFESSLGNKQLEAYKKYTAAKNYQTFVMKRRDMKYIKYTLDAAKPMVLYSISDLDKNEYLLNVPGATIDLRDGSSYTPKSSDFITKQTTVSPSDKGMDIWLDALNLIFCSDQELIDYVQEIVGLAAVGKVLMEALIIAHGDGRNGKSTFWNTISKVMGTYSGSISADALTVGCRRNVKPEMAELKGKRIVIAAELEEGMRLNTSVVKQLASTDEIAAEKKYKDPFKFRPSHMVVLYTNHLPRVGAIDSGTWRRLIVIPFNAKIEGASDIKNYADYLYSHSGEAVMKWIIEGAKKAIYKEGKIEAPKVVKDAIEKYHEGNDWIHIFLDDCCDIDKPLRQKSGELYSEYRAYCLRSGEYARSTTDFYSALEMLGFERHKTKSGVIILGLKLKDGEDFL